MVSVMKANIRDTLRPLSFVSTSACTNRPTIASVTGPSALSKAMCKIDIQGLEVGGLIDSGRPGQTRSTVICTSRVVAGTSDRIGHRVAMTVVSVYIIYFSTAAFSPTTHMQRIVWHICSLVSTFVNLNGHLYIGDQKYCTASEASPIVNLPYIEVCAKTMHVQCKLPSFVDCLDSMSYDKNYKSKGDDPNTI